MTRKYGLGSSESAKKRHDSVSRVVNVHIPSDAMGFHVLGDTELRGVRHGSFVCRAAPPFSYAAND